MKSILNSQGDTMRKQTMMILLLTMVLAAATSSGRPRVIRNRAVGASAPVQEKVTVKISSFKFDPKVVTVAPGTTVEWVNEGGRHTVEADNGSFKSDVLKQGDKFEHKFDKAGTFAYHCEFHGEKGGKDMAGSIVVRLSKKP
jgi:plastocyanin